MSREEIDEGKKDAGVDHENHRKKRPLTHYLPDYQKGYNDEWERLKSQK